jgi:acetate kinase
MAPTNEGWRLQLFYGEAAASIFSWLKEKRHIAPQHIQRTGIRVVHGGAAQHDLASFVAFVVLNPPVRSAL